MIKRIFIYIFVCIFCYINTANAEDIVGFGLHIGAQNDVGNINSYDPDIQIYPQNNYFLGLSCKSNFVCLFVRSGVDTTFLINRGEVLEDSSDEIASIKIHYVSIPFFFGFNYLSRPKDRCRYGKNEISRISGFFQNRFAVPAA